MPEFEQGQLVVVTRPLYRCACGDANVNSIVRVVNNKPGYNNKIKVEVTLNGCTIDTPESRLRKLTSEEIPTSVERFAKASKYERATVES